MLITMYIYNENKRKAQAEANKKKKKKLKVRKISEITLSGYMLNNKKQYTCNTKDLVKTNIKPLRSRWIDPVNNLQPWAGVPSRTTSIFYRIPKAPDWMEGGIRTSDPFNFFRNKKYSLFVSAV